MIQPTLGNQGGFFCVRPAGRTFSFSALESGPFSDARPSQRTRVSGSELFLKTRGSGPFELKTEGASDWVSTVRGWVAFLDRDSQRSSSRFRCRFTVQHPVLNPCYRGSRAHLNDGSRCSRWATGSPRSLPRNFRGCLEKRGGRKGLRPPSSTPPSLRSRPSLRLRGFDGSAAMTGSARIRIRRGYSVILSRKNGLTSSAIGTGKLTQGGW